MLVNNVERTIYLNTNELLPNHNIMPTFQDIDMSNTLFYLDIEILKESEFSDKNDCSLGEINIKLKSIKPAYHYLSICKIDDYRLVIDNKLLVRILFFLSIL